MAPNDSKGMPDEVQTLLQKHNRMKFFIAQYEEEWNLLEKIKESCSDLVTHKERAKHLSLYGPGQPCKLTTTATIPGVQNFDVGFLTDFPASANPAQARPQRMDDCSKQCHDEAGHCGGVSERL